MQATPAKTSKQRWFAPLKLAVSVGLLVLLLWTLDAAAVARVLGQLPLAAVAAAMVLLIVQTAVLGLRWWLVMAAIEAPLKLGKILPLTFMGVFFNQVLPTSFGGDAVRIWQAHRLGIHTEAAVIGVLLERISGVFGLVLLTALGALTLGVGIGSQAVRLGLLLTLPAAVAGILILALLDRMPERWRRLPVLKEATRLARDSRRVFLAPGTALPLLLLSLLSHGLAAGAVYAFALGLQADLPLWTCIALFSAVILVTTIPISFAGWGLREGAMVVLFAFAGVNADTALALSLAFGVALLAASLPGCACWLAWRGPPMLESAPRPMPDSR